MLWNLQDETVKTTLNKVFFLKYNICVAYLMVRQNKEEVFSYRKKETFCTIVTEGSHPLCVNLYQEQGDIE